MDTHILHSPTSPRILQPQLPRAADPFQPWCIRTPTMIQSPGRCLLAGPGHSVKVSEPKGLHPSCAKPREASTCFPKAEGDEVNLHSTLEDLFLGSQCLLLGWE